MKKIVSSRAAAMLSLLALCGAAQAAEVSIYGRVETSVSSVNAGTSVLSGATGGNTARGNSVSVNGLESRLGFRGLEDLGGGVKAMFELEQRFRPDDGRQAVNNLAFSGRSVVGLSSPALGQITLGRDYLPAMYVALRADPYRLDSTVGQLGIFHTFAGYNGYAVRAENAVSYTLPQLVNGLVVRTSTSTYEGTGKRHGLSVSYDSGPLGLAYGYDRRSGGDELHVAAASYDFRIVKPVASYSRSEVLGLAVENYSLGASAPLLGGTVRALWAQLDPRGLPNTTKMSLGYEYGLSKRTSIFSNVGTAHTDGLSRTTGADVGVRHLF